jgi:SAM-dependent methyltransferase
MNKLNKILSYENAYLADYGFEKVLVKARQQVVIDCLTQYQPKYVLEVGCGTDLLSDLIPEINLDIKQWVTVEPSPAFAQVALDAKKRGQVPGLEVVQGFIEESEKQVRDIFKSPPDFVICSGLLHEVEHPAELLKAMRNLVDVNGVLHVNVPNALSLHRRLAKEMGLIPNEHELSERNQQLGQFYVFDLNSLRSLVEREGFVVKDSGGYFLKPFTHKQMEGMSAILTPDILQGLYKMGRSLPELASEIYVNVEPAH